MGVPLLLGWPLRVPADLPVRHVALTEIDADTGATTSDQPDAARAFGMGLPTKLDPWLMMHGLAEAESYHDDFHVERGRDDASGHDTVVALQLGLIVDLFELAEAEVVLEYATDTDELVADEAFVTFERDPWALALGRQYTPFGVYFSNFASSPIIEFGETRAKEAATLSFTPGDAPQLSLTLYRGRAKQQHRQGRHWKWVVAAEGGIGEHWSLGLSYQSDLADADSDPLQDYANRHARRVPGVSGYARWADECFAASLEIVAATRAFAELEQDRNQPWAWNAEVVHFLPETDLELALRIEGSRELEDAPRYQYGAALTWQIRKSVRVTLEYLHGEFTPQLATSNQDESYTHVDRLGGKLSIEF